MKLNQKKMLPTMIILVMKNQEIKRNFK